MKRQCLKEERCFWNYFHKMSSSNKRKNFRVAPLIIRGHHSLFTGKEKQICKSMLKVLQMWTQTFFSFQGFRRVKCNLITHVSLLPYCKTYLPPPQVASHSENSSVFQTYPSGSVDTIVPLGTLYSYPIPWLSSWYRS